MPMTQKEMVKLLSKHGFYEVKNAGKGSHIKMMKEGLPRPIIIPHGELNKFTEEGILKSVGLFKK